VLLLCRYVPCSACRGRRDGGRTDALARQIEQAVHREHIAAFRERQVKPMRCNDRAHRVHCSGIARTGAVDRSVNQISQSVNQRPVPASAQPQYSWPRRKSKELKKEKKKPSAKSHAACFPAVPTSHVLFIETRTLHRGARYPRCGRYRQGLDVACLLVYVPSLRCVPGSALPGQGRVRRNRYQSTYRITYVCIYPMAGVIFDGSYL